MKPTAPPVKRGRPGTNGARNSAISRRSAGTNGSSVSVVTPERSMIVLPRARAQHEERVLAEERVARDLLAAFDALEEERVVGVLGDLQKGRDRRQQVRHDLLDDRHERAAPRQLHELFERRLLHDSRGSDGSPSARAGKQTGRRPLAGPQLELPLRLRDEHLEAADRRGSPRRAAACINCGRVRV